jgi:hypothetical protein
MGGKSSDNSEITNLQKEQAEEARAKDAARQARISTGLEAIKNAFQGNPIYETRTVNVPASQQVTGTPATTRQERFQRQTGNGGMVNDYRTVRVPGTQQTVAVPASTRSEQVFTGRRSGGIDDNFYNQYNQGVTDYLLPQVTDQYTDAKKKTEFDLARAGTSKSSAANETFADLAKQKENQEADVRKTADTATGALRTRVANEQAKLQAQLYATENPDVASDQALAAVKNISLDTPAISALGDVFKTALIGGANAITGFKNQQSINDVRAAAKDATYRVGN